MFRVGMWLRWQEDFSSFVGGCSENRWYWKKEMTVRIWWHLGVSIDRHFCKVGYSFSKCKTTSVSS